MKQRNIHIAIIGAGIGGLIAAIALLRANIKVEIFEQTAQLSEVGAGLQISPNVVRLLQRLGLGARLRELAVRPASMELRNWQNDQLIARYPMGDAIEARYGAPHYILHRADLHTLLYEQIPAECIHLGKCCTGVKQDSTGAELAFADGTIVHANAVIGADGIHSVIRKMIADDIPQFAGTRAYRGLIPAQRLTFLAQDEPSVKLWLGPQRHIVCYPISAGRLFNLVAVVPAGDWRVESWMTEGRIEDLATEFADWAEPIQRIIYALDSIKCGALYDRQPLERWSTGLVTLLGDAAHPMLPHQAQGAGQAIEDAVVLAGCLKNITIGHIPEGLLRYETLRRPRTTRVQEGARANGKTFQLSDRQQQQQRDQALHSENPLMQDWLLNYDVEQALAEKTDRFSML
ncbi:MAG TPA: FAD-dependent monooxygenase [Ktedonobacteraceae bacterium]|jgi:salicylate hydroxylase